MHSKYSNPLTPFQPILTKYLSNPPASGMYELPLTSTCPMNYLDHEKIR